MHRTHMLRLIVSLAAAIGMVHAAIAQTPPVKPGGNVPLVVAQNNADTQNDQQDSSDTEDQNFTVSPDAEQALYDLYGGKRWKDKRLSEYLDHTTGYVIPLFEKRFKENGKDKLLALAVISDRKDDWGCSTCAPPIGGAVFVKHHGKWVVESRNKIMLQTGGYGQIGDIHLVRIAKDKLGVSITTTSGNMGDFSVWETILVPYHGLLSDALDVGIPESPSESACENPLPRQIVNVRFEQTAGSTYFDAIATTGYNDGSCEDYIRRVETAHYSLQNGKYKLISRVRHAKEFKFPQTPSK